MYMLMVRFVFAALQQILIPIVFLTWPQSGDIHMLILRLLFASDVCNTLDLCNTSTIDSPSLGRMRRPLDDFFPSRDGYIRPEFQKRMQLLRPTILDAAARHNPRELSGMSDEEFATIIALVLYNEHNGWFEDLVTPVRPVTPLYQQLQVELNKGGLGSNFSVWPANLRPSVALEILRHELPVPDQSEPISVPVNVANSRISLDAGLSQSELYAQITAEISQDDMAVEFLAANLARGVYRAEYEQVPVSWRALAAWHNQGIVRPQDIQANPTAKHYVQRAGTYLNAARQLIESPSLDEALSHHSLWVVRP
jgi:hypothetical protein